MMQVMPSAMSSEKFLFRAGVAYDAHESIVGLITIDNPKSFFDASKVSQATWWGEFKPFKTWGRPKLFAQWFDPTGKMVLQQSFQGLHCRLAKTTLNFPQQKVQMSLGNWRVEVSMKGSVIDQKTFVVYNSAQPQAAPQPQSVNVQSSVQSEGVQF